MTLDFFFEKFDLFADAPDAVAKMRELVLELAVQGKLSENRVADTKEVGWLKLVTQLEADSSDSNSAIEMPFEIPSWWRWTTLERLGDTKPRNDGPDNSRSSFVPMTLIPAEYGQSARHEERPWGEIKKGYTHFKNGDVVMAKITPCFENGKSAVINGLTGGFGAGTTELHVFRRSGEVVLAEFVILYLKTRGFIARGEPRMTGSAGQKRVPHNYFAKSPFPLPPLAEQKRIVAKVDELMALCDRLEAQQEECEARHAALARASLARFADAPTPANLQFLFHPFYAIPPADLRKSILTLAVQGKLVPQELNDERPETTFPGLKPANPEASDGAEPPNRWTLCTYRSLTSLVTSGSRGWKEFFSEKGSIFVRTQNIKTDTLILEDVAFVDLPKSAEGMRAQLLKNDILITITGANVTKAARVEEPIPEAYVSQHIALTRPRWSEMSEWLHLCFVSHGSARAALEQLAYGDKPGLNLNNIRDLVLPVPPLAEQHRIVSKVEQLMALVDQLEAQLAASRAAAANLLSALVAELTEPKVKEKPDSKIIHLHSTPEFIRACLAAEIVARCHDHDSFGQTKLQKIIHLAEYIFELPEIDSHPRRFARGPHDPEVIRQSEAKMAQCEWFKPVQRAGGPGWRYVPLAHAGGHRQSFEEQWPAKAEAIRGLSEQLKAWPTDRCERFATVYAAWNDLLIWKRPATDEAILSEILDHWHPEKQNIPRSKWCETLAWIRQSNCSPTGFGRSTRDEPSPTLFPI